MNPSSLQREEPWHCEAAGCSVVLTQKHKQGPAVRVKESEFFDPLVWLPGLDSF